MQKNAVYIWANIWHCILDKHSGENLVKYTSVGDEPELSCFFSL